uniref:Uncharacterized protein n=1 Tax=Arundo donax TaxID=35708 RepID=A0A0A9FC78_ARUDO
MTLVFHSMMAFTIPTMLVSGNSCSTSPTVTCNV